MTPHRFSHLLGVVVLLAGCNGGGGVFGGDLQSTLMLGGEYDTTGAVIVDHRAIPADLPVWEIEDTTTLRIGRASGEGPDVFGRIAAVATTSTGDIVVADSRPLEIRQFDRQGQLRFKAGREGEGPGEFRWVAGLLVLPGDSIVILETAPPRAVLFDPLGNHIRTNSLKSDDPEKMGTTDYQGALDNGTIVATRSIRSGSLIRRDHRRFLKVLTYLNRDGLELYRGPRFFDPVLFSERVSIPQPNGPVDAVVMRVPPIAGRAEYAVRGNRVAVGVQGRGEILVYDSAAKLIMVLRPPGWGLRTNRERFTETLRADRSDSPKVVSEATPEEAALQLPDTLPGFERVMLDAIGRIWVEEFVPNYDTREASWWVFDAEGRFLARAKFPIGFDPRAIEATEVVGISRDADDVQYVEVRRIVTASDSETARAERGVLPPAQGVSHASRTRQ